MNSAQGLRHDFRDFKADHRTAATTLESTLEETHEILRFFFNLDVTVSDHPEDPLPQNFVSREQPCGEKAQRVFQSDETDIRAGAFRRQVDEALERVRHRDQRVHCAPVTDAAQMHRKIQPRGSE